MNNCQTIGSIRIENVCMFLGCSVNHGFVKTDRPSATAVAAVDFDLDRALEAEKRRDTCPLTAPENPHDRKSERRVKLRVLPDPPKDAEPAPEPELPARHRRFKRKHAVRPTTWSVRRLKIALRLQERARKSLPPGVTAPDDEVLPDPTEGFARPKTRADCVNGPRPCPWASCKHHLYLDVSSKGAIKLNRPDLEIDELSESCALDVADRGVATLEEVGGLMNMVRERVRQIEVTGLAKLRKLRAIDHPGSADADEDRSMKVEDPLADTSDLVAELHRVFG